MIVVGEDSTRVVAVVIAVVVLDERRRQARGESRHLFGHGHGHGGDGEGWSGRYGDPRGNVFGVAAVGGILIFVTAVVVLLVSSEGARVAVGLAAAVGEAGERLRRPGTESKLFSSIE